MTVKSLPFAAALLFITTVAWAIVSNNASLLRTREQRSVQKEHEKVAVPMSKRTKKGLLGLVSPPPGDTIPPLEEREGDFVTDPTSNAIDLKDPSAIEKDVTYDPETGNYIISEKIGDAYYRTPTYMTFEEYIKWTEESQRYEYFESQRRNSVAGAVGSNPMERYRPNIQGRLVDRIFGSTKVDIRPQGNIDLTFGGDYQRVDNPALTVQQRTVGGFDFDMAIQMNVVGSIGDKLKLGTNFNTLANFDFQNQLKLGHTGSEDDILQKIEAGNVSLPLRSTLIQGSQSLFGLKTELRFGRLNVTALASQQKSRRQNLQIQGGTQLQTFDVTVDNYDENRHFFLSHYNRGQYEPALRNLPAINSLMQITRMEVWVTNTRNATTDTRDVVAFSDLGESSRIANGNFSVMGDAPRDIAGQVILPSNKTNDLYSRLLANPDTRSLDRTVATLQGASFNMSQVRDFEKVRGRLLQSSEFSYEPQLGYISVNVTLQPDDVLAVAYQYTYNGQTYQVGEFAQDVPIDADTLNVLYLKMLKSTNARVDLPLWDLMMKNVYSIGAYSVNQQDFKLDVLYQEPGGGERRFLPEGPRAGVPLITLFNLDRLNSQLDPLPDGQFDFVSGITINPRNGKVIFPVLEPFGSYLDKTFDNDPVKKKYVYQQLYDSTITKAREYPEFNRFVMRGSYRSSSSSELSLGAFNIPQGSVKVTAGGQQLVEGRDYEVDYNIGRVKILNESIMQSGVPVNVSFEDNSLFGFQTRTLFGTRLDYKVSDDFTIGGTFMRLSERPFTQKVNIGDDPIANNVYGLDVQYSKEAPWLTKLIDKLPLLQTKEQSKISFSAEGAWLKPGHSKAIDQTDNAGVVYLDDFEGSTSNIDLRTQPLAWALASTPRGRFPEADLVNDLAYGYNRAKLAWYRIDPTLRDDNTISAYEAQYSETDVFPNYQNPDGNFTNQLFTLDVAYYPEERGPYNFDVAGKAGISAGIDNTGKLKDPKSRWGGITRSIETNDFEAANVEFIEVWMLSPFLEGRGGTSGEMVINLGNVSEDVLRDSRNFFENGLPAPGSNIPTDETNWSRVPRTQAITNAFDNDLNTRTAQDVGFDGFADEDEKVHFQDYLSALQVALGFIPPDVNDDPSGDNYLYFKDESYETANTGILERYKKFNGPEGNSPVQTGNSTLSSAATNNPDSEDLNRDNSLSESEAYFEYRIPLQNDGTGGMPLSQYIVDEVDNRDANGNGDVWYQLKIPINQFTNRVGSIQDFRSIRFVRLYFTGWEEETVFRFGRFQLVRNQWRRYTRTLIDPAVGTIGDDLQTSFDVTPINIEQNSSKVPYPYVLPPGIVRENSISAVTPNSLQNEQSLSMRVCNLADGDARGIFKNINFDMRMYEHLKMFVHAERNGDLDPTLADKDLTVFVRMGGDFENNYYEYEVPLYLTTGATTNPFDIWLDSNSMDIPLALLRDAKVQRGTASASQLFVIPDPDHPEKLVKVKGNPDLGLVKGIMIGIRNKVDDGMTHCAEVWINELRLSGLDETGGNAAIARVDLQLADFGNISASSNYSGIGWGSLEQRVAQRAREQILQFDVSGNVELGKLLPKKSGVRIPLYAQYSDQTKTPQFDPYTLDIPFKELIRAAPETVKDSLREQALTTTKIRSVNLTNVHKERTNTQRKPMPWDIANFSATYAFSRTEKTTPTIEKNDVKIHRGALDYQFNTQPKYIKPFDKLIKKGKYLQWIKEFNFNPVPSSLTVRNELNRQFGEVKYRFTGDSPYSTFFDKRFTWDRNYGLQWNLAQNLNLSFTALNNAVIDEPFGRLDTQLERDTVINNLKKFGRPKNYNHTASASYTLPTKKIPILDWMNIRGQYNTNFKWAAASLNADTLGNVLQNGMTWSVNGDFNLVNFYNKSKYLKKINTPPSKKEIEDRKKGKQPTTQPTTPDKQNDNSLTDDAVTTPKPDDKKNKEDKKKKEHIPSVAERILLRPIMMLRNVKVNYSEAYTSIIPGYTPRTRILGQNPDFTAPGWDYAFGIQPNSKWLDNGAQQGWFTTNPYLNQQVQQTYTQTADGKVTLEPFRDFRIDVDANRTYSKNHSEFFKVFDPSKGFQHLIPQQVGSLSVSYLPIRTLFTSKSDSTLTENFRTFENNRQVISDRLGLLNPASGGSHPTDNGYAEGYGRYQQDVLIPAFIAAYSGQDASKVNLNIFNTIPLPNWRLSYNGLSKVGKLNKVFETITLSHGYSSKLTVNSFKTNLNFDDQYDLLTPSTQSYYARYEIPDVVITESFSPLIGIDTRLKNDVSLKFEYKKSRNLNMSFTDYQLVESQTTDLTFGAGYRIKNVKFPIKLSFGKTKQTITNDVNLKLDFSVRDDITINHLLDQNQSLPTRGLKTIRISPTADYSISQQLSLRLFFDYSRTMPATAQQFPITNAKGGLTIRFALTQ